MGAHYAEVGTEQMRMLINYSKKERIIGFPEVKCTRSKPPNINGQMYVSPWKKF